VALIGDHPAMREVYKLIGRLATNDVPALIVGERGTGKGLIVSTLHDSGSRRGRPLLVIDCAHPNPTLEEDLFAPGIGTVHLENVESLPLPLQVRLGRALSNPGRAPGRPLEARVIASTDRDLADAVASGSFSRELLDAVALITIRLPPLRERREDIPLLIRYFVQRFNVELNRTIKGVDEPTLRRLQDHAWPGNVGQLERVLKHGAIVARGDVITSDDVGSLTDTRFQRGGGAESALGRAVRSALHDRLVDASSAPSASAFHDIVDLVETTLVKEALAITNRNQVKAADLLGVNRSTIRKKAPPEDV
jgi:DNA-binding NtrC family response regulator